SQDEGVIGLRGVAGPQRLPHGGHEELWAVFLVEVPEGLLVAGRDEALLGPVAVHAVGVLGVGDFNLGEGEGRGPARVPAGGAARAFAFAGPGGQGYSSARAICRSNRPTCRWAFSVA